ncbi:Inner membrane protein YbaN [Botrimarina colliarenosi]|uniref:Inner membrane protein YbaN n=1 Tax=Botrimarina colliarenosi TaxID=2528001 RepID=A0A5C6AIL6_9BACT|nr:YbaN family protein [Botrimarina colliarenosi]TWT99902.1 Inner membrane protein YbaN [Botrimarina colliarenosi]
MASLSTPLPLPSWANEPTPGIEIARRVLADPSVRSLTIDRTADEATVRYRGQTVHRASLAWLSGHLAAETVLLNATAAIALPADSVERWPESEGGRESYVRTPRQATGWRRVMHLTLAGVWFTLAVLGAILPGLPCTCFLLLTSYSLCRSSQRLHQRLLDSKWFGPSLRHWRLHRGVRPGVKTKALGAMAVMIGASLLFAPLPPVAWWAVAIAGAVGAAVVMRLRVVAC